MEGPQKMDVIEWRDSPPPIVPETGAARRFLPPTLIGVVGTVIFHALILQYLPFGLSGTKRKPPETDASAIIFTKSTADPEGLVLISLPIPANTIQVSRQSATLSLPELRKLKIRPSIEVDPPEAVNLETLPLGEGQNSNPVNSGEQGAELARLFGIYTGQIQARIDRVWRRPRTRVNEEASDKKAGMGEESFQCEAQIVQDNTGNVQEILLPRCNGSLQWQHSLIVAIQQASPLPAPPDPAVFERSVTLRFLGLSYVKGVAEDEYEREPRNLARVQ